jgi:methionine sulfoxide reductase heme-binding subunit
MRNAVVEFGKPLAAGLAVGALVILAWAAVSSAGGQFSWYAARSAGMLAYVLAAGSVMFGIAASTKLGGKVLGKSNITDVHRALSLLSILAIGAHTLFLGLDQYADFTLSELFIPFVTWYRPVWTSFGIIAAYAAVAVYVSFYLRPVIGYKAWRSFHYVAFGVFGLGTLHGLFAGADTSELWAQAIYGACTAGVVALLAYRIASRQPRATVRLDTVRTA